MSYILKLNGEQVAISGGWNPVMFSNHTQTSYPTSVDTSYVWEQDGYWLGWEDDPIPEPQPPYVPHQVSMRQARLALLQSGLLATIDAAIAQGSEADKIEWEYATEVRRDSPLVTNLATALGLTEEQLDNLFVTASGL